MVQRIFKEWAPLIILFSLLLLGSFVISSLNTGYEEKQPSLESMPEAVESIEFQTYINEEYGFQFEYPNTHSVERTGFHGDGDIPGHDTGIVLDPKEPDFPRLSLSVSLPSDTSLGYNPKGKTLEDYTGQYETGGYHIGKYGVKRNAWAIIHSQEMLELSKTQVLKQIYSVGLWKEGDDHQGDSFDTSTSIDGVDHALRYVFFDGKDKFIIMRAVGASTPENEQSADLIARSFTFN